MTIALDQSEAGIYVSGHLVADGGTQFNIGLIQKLSFFAALFTTMAVQSGDTCVLKGLWNTPTSISHMNQYIFYNK